MVQVMVAKLLITVSIVSLLSGCASVNRQLSSFGDSAESVDDLAYVSYYATDQLITEGKVQFRERNFGKSYSLFKKAASVYPNDPMAWLGYAASADHLARFDNSDMAYKRLSSMIPDRPAYLNNVGYSYLLRGNLVQARRYFLRAYEIDPANETTANNLELLRGSTTTIQRG